MLDFSFLHRTLTPGERVVVVVMVASLSVILGAVCLYVGFTAPPAKAQQAAELRWYGVGLILCAAIIGAIYGVMRHLRDRL